MLFQSILYSAKCLILVGNVKSILFSFIKISKMFKYLVLTVEFPFKPRRYKLYKTVWKFLIYFDFSVYYFFNFPFSFLSSP